MNDKQLMQLILRTARADNLIDDDEAARVLKISKMTLYNKVYRGNFSSFYAISLVNGKKFWFKDKIMGL